MQKLENYNMNFDKRVVIETLKEKWIPSPSSKVMRIPLERKDQESGHTTSFVEYLPGASFKKHPHPLGEEIFVLEGIFSDEYGDYGPGSYIRNPPGSSHSPFSKKGCKIFVKLNQFLISDTQRVHIETQKSHWLHGHGNLKVMPLHSYGTSQTALVKWPMHERFNPHTHYGGEEIFILKGSFKDEHGTYPKYTWIRNPHMSHHHPWVDEETIILVKTGHLPLNHISFK